MRFSGNESVRLPKLPLHFLSLFRTLLLPSDLCSFSQQLVFRKCKRRWQSTRTSLRLIKFIIFLWPSSYLPSLTKETTLCRLQIENLPFTHSYLLLNLFSPECLFCPRRESHCIPSPVLLDCQTLLPFYLNYHLPWVTFFVTSALSLIISFLSQLNRPDELPLNPLFYKTPILPKRPKPTA